MSGRVDPARDADDDGVEAVLRDVVAEAEHERASHLLEVVVERRDLSRLGPLEVDDEKRLLEAGRSCQHAPVALEHERVAVEDELVLSADRVAQRDTHAALARARREDRLAFLCPTDVERGGREVDDELRARRGEFRRRRPGNPHVLADRDPDLRAGDVDQREAVARSEVALLVEDAVVRHVPLLRPSRRPRRPRRSRTRCRGRRRSSGTPTSATMPRVAARDLLERSRAAARTNPGRSSRSSGG